MGVAWSAGRTGQASADVIVRDQIVAQATLPRFLAIGDQSRFHLQVDNVEGPAGAYTVDLDVKGPVVVAADATRRTMQLAAGAKTQMTIPVTAAGLGRAEFDVRVSGPNGIGTVQNLAVRVQPSADTIARRIVRADPRQWRRDHRLLRPDGRSRAELRPGLGDGLALRLARRARRCSRRSTATPMAAPSRPSRAPCRC